MLKNKILSFIAINIGLGFGVLHANIDSFEIDISPKQAKVGDAVDLTIKALDSSGNVFKEYTGDILIFSDSDVNAEFPGVLSDNTYKFKTSDQGTVKFENAVRFTKSGKQYINVFDAVIDDVFGIGEITIGTTDVAQAENTEITIATPSNGTTLGSSTVRLSGKTQRNHAVSVSLNLDKTFEAISNAEGMFDVEITGLEAGENILIATVLDASGKVIGTSSEIKVNFDAMVPSIRAIKTNPENTIESEAVFTIEITSNPGLRTVQVILDDFAQTLQEGASGIYTGQLTAPKTEGNYKIDVKLTTEIGTTTEIKAAKEILITPISQNAANPENPEQSCEDIAKDLEVKNAKVTKMKSKSVITWDATPKAGSYNVYKKNRTTQALELVENVNQPRIEINIVGDIVEYDDFVIKAVLDDGQCNIESPNSAEMTKVQTGPKEMILLLIAVGIAAFLLRRKNVNA